VLGPALLFFGIGAFRAYDRRSPRRGQPQVGSPEGRRLP